MYKDFASTGVVLQLSLASRDNDQVGPLADICASSRFPAKDHSPGVCPCAAWSIDLPRARWMVRCE